MPVKNALPPLPNDDPLIAAKRRARMDRVDAMPAELRALVQVYGLAVVTALMQVGVTKPRHIRHVVETVLDEFSPSRGTYSHQGIRGQVD